VRELLAGARVCGLGAAHRPCWAGVCLGGSRGVGPARLRLRSICFLASTVCANGPKEAVRPVNKWLLGLASKYPGLALFQLKESCVPVQVCGAGDAA